jgi:hypothetical protein
VQTAVAQARGLTRRFDILTGESASHRLRRPGRLLYFAPFFDRRRCTGLAAKPSPSGIDTLQ